MVKKVYVQEAKQLTKTVTSDELKQLVQITEKDIYPKTNLIHLRIKHAYTS
jgi:hypothetical protein